MGWASSPANPYVGHFEARLARPGPARDRPRNRAAVRDDLIEPNLSRVALRNRIRGQEAEVSPLAQEARGLKEEVSAKIRAATLPAGNLIHKVFTIELAQVARDFLAPHERRVADEGVEAATLPHHLGKLQRPVNWSLAIEPGPGLLFEKRRHRHG